MRPAADRLAARLAESDFQDSEIPVVQNADACLRRDAAEIKHGLVKQLYQPVRWVDCVRRLQELHCGSLIECGPGKVLTGLIRRIDKEINAVAIGEADSFDKALGGVKI
jgi:[acyl-carrier-protein] S-malonyltransferase